MSHKEFMKEDNLSNPTSDNSVYIRKSRHSTQIDDTVRISQARIERHMKIFASMCPDEILDFCDDYQTRVYHTTLMLGDVSGFTDLAEKYTKAGKGGPSKLTETLNSYIGAMVQEILSHNGDVLKFSGDAFIVMWKLEEGMTMRDLAVEAIQTACIIQKHFGVYETDVDVTLRVKLAIASGKTYFTSIGDSTTMSYYIITGKPVWDAKNAEVLCRGGDIIVAPSSWQWANPNEYVFETLPDGIHTLIIACSSAWYQSKGDDATSFADDEENEGYSLGFKRSQTSIHSKMYTEDDIRTALMNTDEEDKFNQIDYSLRPKVVKAAKGQLKEALRSYMLRPVLRSVEMDEPLEYLTEMRQVVILFVNVITANIGKKSLISLVDAAYKIVCMIVGGMQGCVNKTSLFDKDLMFLCIFGLRGDKHELESQIGLRCASKIRQKLVAIKSVESVTIGVTTGMTYCGVVGHILRREYTVIGMSVNKAARLMCAYRDKVVCDRESFLHSHLEAQHFILQEPRYLKGITSVGPVYEYQDEPKQKVSDLVWRKYPILGRDFEIKVFRQMLSNIIEYNNIDNTRSDRKPRHNTLIIKGESRIGKTRLLDEITQNIPPAVPCHYISLVANDSKVPFALIYLLFSIALGFTATSTQREREEKICSRLGIFRDQHFLAVLNKIFNVGFPISNRYKILGEYQKRKVLRQFLQTLMIACFNFTCVILVDDAEYSDDDSLQLLDAITKSDTVLFVLSFGRKFSGEYKLQPNFQGNAKVLELTGIDKLYHAGLACQILNVGGIPAELEKAIQEKSLGNPGWIENYLVSLVQTGELVMLNISQTEADKKGYVLPPASMLKRFVSTSSKNLGVAEERMDKWQMYRLSVKDSVVSLITTNDSLHRSTIEMQWPDTTITVCEIAKNCSLENVEGEITLDVMILRLFDSLTHLDQLLLKCASVLGESVNRQLLENLMEDTSRRDIALAVLKLFEIGVFSCGAGDFSKYRSQIVYFRNVRNPDSGINAVCECVGLVIPNELSNLPKHASCGLMRFKMTMFRETTYKLLTENQKMELHSKALKYIRKYARRCVACGEGQFTRLLGKTAIQNPQNRKLTDIDQILENFMQNMETSSTFRYQNQSDPTTCCLNFCKNVERKSTNIFANIDFANCECHVILMSVYSQILDHCHGIGRNSMTLTAILESVEICLMSQNVPQAKKLLVDAENIFQQMSESYEDEPLLLSYISGKIQILQGRCFLYSGLLAEAEETLESAMRSLTYKFPRTDFAIDAKLTLELEELRFRLMFFNSTEVMTAEEDSIDYTEQLANCLAQMFHVFRMKGWKKHARLAAIWGLNAAMSSTKDFKLLCISLTNLLVTAHVYRHRSILPLLEKLAIEICANENPSLELQELKMIADLYIAVSFSRWVRGLIIKAAKIGFLCVRMTRTLNSASLKLKILPRLIHLLMISCRLSEVVVQLRELEFLSHNILDKSGKTWYYALCADVLLDTGLTVLPFRECEQYYLKEGDMMMSTQDPEADRRYFTSMWLWCLRTEQWEFAHLWYQHNIIMDDIVMDEDIVTASITTLKYLEGLLILYVHEVNSRTARANKTMAEIKEIFKKVEKMNKIVKIAVPRYILLRAYFNMTQSRRKTAMKLLKKGKKLSLRMDNRLMYTWMTHCQQVWSGSLSFVQKDLWREKCTANNRPNWKEINANSNRVISYTFPLPQYMS